MPILYDEITVDSNGILTVQEFKPPINGRMVKFILPNGYIQKEVYTCIDGKFDGPFTSAAPLETSISGLELLRTGCHTANVIVINTGEAELTSMPLKFNPIRTTLSTGEQVSVHLSGTLTASVRVTSTESLLLDYINNGITSAERRIQSVLLECFRSEIVRQIPENIGSFHAMNGLGVLDALSENIKRTACQNAEQFLKYPWFKIVSCSLDLVFSNMDEIIAKANYLWNIEQIENTKRFDTDEALRKEREQLKLRLIDKTFDALSTVYTRDPIPKEIEQIIVAIAQNRPDISTNDLISTCERLRGLSQIYSPEMLLKNVRLLGFLPDNSNP